MFTRSDIHRFRKTKRSFQGQNSNVNQISRTYEIFIIINMLDIYEH